MQDSVLRSPYDGVITKRLIEPSQQISPGQAAFEIEGQGGLEVRVLVPESLIQAVDNGMIVPLHFPAAPSVEMNGVVTEIGTRAETANAFPINVALSKSSTLLRAGMTAELDFTFKGRGRTNNLGETLLIPLAALLPGPDQTSFVFVYDASTQVLSKREVLTENILDNQVYVSSGLKPGEIIAIAGVSFLRDGQTVSLLDHSIQRFN